MLCPYHGDYNNRLDRCPACVESRLHRVTTAATSLEVHPTHEDEHTCASGHQLNCAACTMAEHRALGWKNRDAELASLRADVERLTRELREARAVIRYYAPLCRDCHSAHGVVHSAFGDLCDTCAVGRSLGGDVEHADAIRAAEKEGE